MKTQVHPVVAAIVVLLALVAVWFAYTRVFTGQVEGTIGPPSGASMPPPPVKGDEEMPKRTKEKTTAAGAPSKSASTPSAGDVKQEPAGSRK